MCCFRCGSALGTARRGPAGGFVPLRQLWIEPEVPINCFALDTATGALITGDYGDWSHHGVIRARAWNPAGLCVRVWGAEAEPFKSIRAVAVSSGAGCIAACTRSSAVKCQPLPVLVLYQWFLTALARRAHVVLLFTLSLLCAGNVAAIQRVSLVSITWLWNPGFRLRTVLGDSSVILGRDVAKPAPVTTAAVVPTVRRVTSSSTCRLRCWELRRPTMKGADGHYKTEHGGPQETQGPTATTLTSCWKPSPP